MAEERGSDAESRVNQVSNDAAVLEKVANPLRRKVIAVVERKTFEKLDYDETARDFWLRPGVLVLPDDLDLEQDRVLTALGKRGLWVRGAILAQNPYFTDIYEQGKEPHVLFARSRLRVMAEVLQALGARQLQYEEADKQHSEREHGAEGRLDLIKVKAGGGFNRKQAEDLRRTVKVNYTWAGGPPDTKKAKQLLREMNLDGDDALRSLVKLRANSENQHQTLTETFDLLHESSSTIELAANLSAGLAGGKAKGSRTKQGRYEYKVAYKIVY